jgi:hypothetical protein
MLSARRVKSITPTESAKIDLVGRSELSSRVMPPVNNLSREQAGFERELG